MKVIFNVAGDILVAELFGELDHHGAGTVRKDIDDEISRFNTKNLIFDFAKVTFMDSSGIGVVLGRYRKLTEKGGHVAIAGCSKTVKNILNMAGIFSLISYADTKEEAIKLFLRKEVS